jgi:hypothetical protein
VWLLIPDATTPGLSTLSCVKAKGECPPEVRIQLNPETRWLSVQTFEPQKAATAFDKVLEVVTCEMKTSEIKARLKPTYQDRAIEEALAEALRTNKRDYIKKGVYAPKKATAPTAPTANEDFADDADTADDGDFETENGQPHYPHSPIGSADSAVAISANKRRHIGKKLRKVKKELVRKLSATTNGAEKPHYPHPPMTSADSAVADFWAQNPEAGEVEGEWIG